MIIRLDAARYTGYLYHFCRSWELLENILNEGLWLKQSELDWVQDPKIAQDRRTKEKRFSSLTRNPSAILNKDVSSWRYGVILDAEKLTSRERVHAMSYGIAPGVHSITISRKNTPDGYAYDAEVDVGEPVRLTNEEASKIFDWAFDPDMEEYVRIEEPTKGEVVLDITMGTVDNAPKGEFLYPIEEYANQVRQDYAEDMDEDEIQEEAERLWESDYDEGKRYLLQIENLPGPLASLLTRSVDEEEERLYTREKGDEVRLGKDAIVGVLIPDVEYFSDIADAFRRVYHIPMYIYRDKNNAPNGSKEYAEFKERVRLNPEIKSLYRFPG